MILISNLRERDIIDRGFHTGANDCIVLPFDPAVAMARIQHQISLKKEYLKTASKSTSTYPNITVPGEGEPSVPETAMDTPELSVQPADQSMSTQDLEELNELMSGSTPAEVSSQSLAQIYEEESGRDRPIPCEMPVSLLINSLTYFCKTIWITQHDLLLTAFENFTPEPNYTLQVLHPKGGVIEIDVTETQRQNITDRGVGALKLNLKITRAPQEYDDLYLTFHHAFKEFGVAGLKAVLRGEDPEDMPSNPNTQIELLDEPEEEPKDHTVAFSSAASSLNITKGTRYKYEKLVGKGGFASVFLVHDNALKRLVAMKVLNHDFSRLGKARTNFLGEAQIAAQFHHANIVFVYEVGELFENQYEDFLDFPKHILNAHPDRLIYFTMQYVEGQTLTKWIRKKQNDSEEKCLHIIIGIAKALAFAHKKGVVHRDIKPDNIMIAPEGNVLVTDFGIATLAKGDQGLPKVNKKGKIEVACTPKYASPEQLQGKKIDTRSDVYSVGVLAYEMLASAPPFKGKTLNELVEKQVKRKPQPLAERRTDINPRLAEIIHRCLEKKPELRYQETDDLLKSLLALEGEKSAPMPSGKNAKENLESLVSEAILVDSRKSAAHVLEKLIAFLNLHKTYDNVEQIETVKLRLTDPALLNLLIEKNLNNDNQQLLYEFFMALESNRAVLKILSWFKNEREPWKKLVLGELAVLSAGRDLEPLAIYGLELNDEEASILLKGFGEISPHCPEPVFAQWSNHAGLKTQKELLKILSITGRDDLETIKILERYAHGSGSPHKEVKQTAAKILSEKTVPH